MEQPSSHLPISQLSIRDQIHQILSSSLDITHLEITDTSANCGGSYSILIVSKDFNGKMTLGRHKLVNQLLKDQIQQLHAFSQKTLTPQQWETEKKSQK